jgi:RND family efflux transporter MFP subunit
LWGYMRGSNAAHGALAAQAATRQAAGAQVMIRVDGQVVAYPGADVVIGTEHGGKLRLLAEERSAVRKGDTIAEIEADEERAALAEARARAVEIAAELKYLDADVGRTEKLGESGSLPRDAVDRSLRDRDIARARREAAWASVKRLEAAVAKARIVAPFDGVVLERHAQPGETVATGSPLVTLADLARTRVQAEVDEFDSGHVKVGGDVSIAAEAWPGQAWRGVIEEVPDEVVSRRLKPLDPAQPTDARVLLAKIALREPTPLRLGQRVQIAFLP